MAKELTRLKASARGIPKPVCQHQKRARASTTLYADGARASRRRTIDASLEKIGLQADKVHDAYQRLIKFEEDERHQDNFYERQHARAPSTTI
jgi:hypothetical protein